MNYSVIKNCDIANGPGCRIVLFVSGCTHHCRECFQPETWNFDYGQPFTQETVDEILPLLAPAYIAGLTLLGGGPFEPQNQPALLDLVRQVRAKYPHKSIWSFSGYTYETIVSGKIGDTREYLKLLDVLVDGPFIQEKKNLSLRFRGSENQRLIDMPATLEKGEIVPWKDWQGDGRGMV